MALSKNLQFQYALFTKKGYLAKGFIHGCETALGNWHESKEKAGNKRTPEVGRIIKNTTTQSQNLS